MSEWQPIETAPKDGSSVLLAVATDDGRAVAGEGWYRDNDDSDMGWWWANESPGDYYAEAIEPRWRITHWMPLPAPPESAS